MNAPAPPSPTPTSKTYELYFLLDGKTLYWRNPNRGVTLTDAGLASAITWTLDGDMRRPESRRWTDIVEVGLMAATDGRAAINHCRIVFRDGRSILITDCGDDGRRDDSRTPIYRDFVRALHARLCAAPAGTIRFIAGTSESRHRTMKVILVIASLFFVGTPLVLLLILRDWHILGVLAAGACFVWPFWKITDKNRPRTYDPRHPPYDVMT